tara:strand:- start:650 stop:1003 length:354 start_codon:yes stop_codon:yes gene_type:complete
MRNVIVLCLLLLFAGSQGLFASNASTVGTFDVAIPTGQNLLAPMKSLDNASVAMLERCCSQDDKPQATNSAAPCIYDCTITADFGLTAGFSARILGSGAKKHQNTVFGNALFRPPIV